MHRISPTPAGSVIRWLSLCSLLVLCVVTMPRCKGGNCFVLCEVGLSICRQGQVQTCMVNAKTNCLEWRVQTCPITQTCVVNASGKAECSGGTNCNDKRASRKCVGHEVYYFDNCDQQREKVTICNSAAECKDGYCTGSGCNECQAGEQRCTSDGWLSLCSRDPAANCYRWAKPISCPEGQVCVNGGCEKGECPKPCVVGEYRCQTKSLQSCVKDKNGCDNWGPIYPCPEGQTCQGGKCIKEVCPGTCKITADCAVTACGEKTECKDGACIKPVGPCKDKCEKDKTRCDGDKLQICRTEPSTGCTDWGPSTSCLDGQVCKDGVCEQEPCPASCTQDSDCDKAACGAKKSCINGKCAVPAQVCPSSCSSDSDCDLPNCLNKRACISGKCSVPPEPSAEPTGDAGPDTTAELPADTRSLWKYGNNVQFQTRNKTNTSTDPAKWAGLLTDFMQHRNMGGMVTKTDPIELAQELIRDIHAELRTTHTMGSTKKVGLYLGNGDIMVLPEPNITKDQVGSYIPAFVKTGSNSLIAQFVNDKQLRNDEPLFLFDEWIVRSQAARVSLDQRTAGKPDGADPLKKDATLNVIEFSIIALATAMAIQAKDPTYLTTNTQFLEFTAWAASATFGIFEQAMKIPVYQTNKASNYLTTLRTSQAADVKAMRDFCKNTFGQQWLTDVIKP